MAKMTLSGLESAMTAYVDAAKQAGSWSASTGDITKMLEKIGLQVTIDGEVNDPLGILEKDVLPLGKTIEEYCIDFIADRAYGSTATEGQSAIEAEAENEHSVVLPTFENAAYSYSLGKRLFEVTIPNNEFEKYMIGGSNPGTLATRIMEKFNKSFAITRYAEKKQILGNLIAKAEAVTKTVGGSTVYPLVNKLAKPSDTTSSEAFILSVKKEIRNASFPNDSCIGQALVGAAPKESLKLFVLKDVRPVIDVTAMSGSFNQDKLGFDGVEIVEVDSFGDNATGCYAILADVRGVGLHNSYNAVRGREEIVQDAQKYVHHYEDTAFISKYTYVKVFEPAA